MTTRRRPQRPKVKLVHLKTRNQWEGQYWNYKRESDGTIIRPKSPTKVVLGDTRTVTETQAQRRLDEMADQVNALLGFPTSAPAPISACKQTRSPYTSAPVLFESVVQEWKQKVAIHNKSSTRKTAESHLNAWLLRKLGVMTLDEIRPKILQDFFNRMQQDGASAKLIRNVRNTLASILNQATAWEYMEHEPLKGLSLPRYEPGEKKVFSIEEVHSLLQNSNGARPIFRTLAETGLRIGELLGLDISDVDLSDRKITVRHAVWRGAIDNPKTRAGKRTLYLSTSLMRTLKAVINGRREGPVFTGKNGMHLDDCNLRTRTLKPILKKLGIKAGGFHTFRHFNASLMDLIGVSGAVQRKRLGHANETVTQSYTHAFEQVERQDVENLAAVIDGLRSPDAEHTWRMIGRMVQFANEPAPFVTSGRR